MAVPLDIINEMRALAQSQSFDDQLLNEINNALIEELEKAKEKKSRWSDFESIANDFLTIPLQDFKEKHTSCDKQKAKLFDIPLTLGETPLLEYLKKNKYVSPQKIKLYVDNILSSREKKPTKKRINAAIVADILTGKLTTSMEPHKAYSYSIIYQILLKALENLGLPAPKNYTQFMEEYAQTESNPVTEEILRDHGNDNTHSPIIEVIKQLADLTNSSKDLTIEERNAITLALVASLALATNSCKKLVLYSISKKLYTDFYITSEVQKNAFDLIIDNGRFSKLFRSWQSTINLISNEELDSTDIVKFFVSHSKDIVTVSMMQSHATSKLEHLNQQEIETKLLESKQKLSQLFPWEEIEIENLTTKNTLSAISDEFNSRISEIPSSACNCQVPLTDVVEPLVKITALAEAVKEGLFNSFPQISQLNEEIISSVSSGDTDAISLLALQLSELKEDNTKKLANLNSDMAPLIKEVNDLVQPVLTVNNSDSDTNDNVSELNEKIAQLSRDFASQEREYQTKVTSLTNDYATLERKYSALAASSKSSHITLTKYLIDDRCTIIEAIDIIKELYPQIEWADNINKQLEECNYGNPKRLLKHLVLLCGEYLDSINAGNPDSTSKSILGNAYSANESESVMNTSKLLSHRYQLVNGKKRLFTKHLTIGSAHNSKTTVQVYFDIENNVMTIGYIGEHLPLP